MYLKLFQRKTIDHRVNDLAKRFQELAVQVCEARDDLKPDDVIKAAQKMAGKWPLSIETILQDTVQAVRANKGLPWEV
jgi:TRAP-type C4-dicarboxylate transport system substrate-binding protein